MARLKRDKAEARDRMLSVRVSASEEAYLRRAAEARGVTVADLVREAIDALLAKEGRRGR